MDKEIRFKFESEEEIKRFCDVLSLLLENKKQTIEMLSEGKDIVIKFSSKKRKFFQKIANFLRGIKKEDMSNILKYSVIFSALYKQPSTVVMNKVLATMA